MKTWNNIPFSYLLPLPLLGSWHNIHSTTQFRILIQPDLCPGSYWPSLVWGNTMMEIALLACLPGNLPIFILSVSICFLMWRRTTDPTPLKLRDFHDYPHRYIYDTHRPPRPPPPSQAFRAEIRDVYDFMHIKTIPPYLRALRPHIVPLRDKNSARKARWRLQKSSR